MEQRLNKILQIVNTLTSCPQKSEILDLMITWKKEDEEYRKQNTKYTLRNKKTKELIQYTVRETNSTNCCGEYEYTLEQDGDEGVWWVDYPLHAVQVLYNRTEWYNAQYDNPNHYLKVEDYEVVNNWGEVINIKPINKLTYYYLHDHYYSTPIKKCNSLTKYIERDGKEKLAKDYKIDWTSLKSYLKNYRRKYVNK